MKFFRSLNKKQSQIVIQFVIEPYFENQDTLCIKLWMTVKEGGSFKTFPSVFLGLIAKRK